MVRSGRPLLLVASALVVALLLGGGLAVKVGAAEGSYRQSVLFAEILGQVLDNYVDPVEARGLLQGAYDGMLASLDPNGAYLTPDEVARWRTESQRGGTAADPGFDILKSGTSFQVISVVPGSAASESGVRVGDHVRSIDGVVLRNLSLPQARWMLGGTVGSTVHVELMHADDNFDRASLELVRAQRKSPRHELVVEHGTAILRLLELRELPFDKIARELEHARSRGVERLLLDLRNTAGADPRDAARVAAAFAGAKPRLELRDRSRRLVESVETEEQPSLWSGPLFVLVNGATAEGTEALAMLLHDQGAKVFGETTFGLGAEPRLFELQDGSGILLSSALWETPDGHSWHESGVTPDEEIRGEGRDFASVSADQLQRVLVRIEKPAEPEEHPAAA